MSFRFAFVPFIKSPEKYPNIVLYYDETVCIIKDAFPKGKVHLLILPRHDNLTKMKPQEAFKEEQKIELIQPYVEQATEMARKLFRKEWKRIDGKDEEVEILVCCHSVPSLNNLHIHVMTKDMCGTHMKNKKHFNSFQTNFAIKFDEFPLKDDDFRMYDKTKCEMLLKQDLVYHKVNYKGSFKKLQWKLQEDFDKIYKRL